MTTAWHEDDAFWRDFAPAMLTPDRSAAAPREIDDVLALTGAAPGAAVLDLACGPGRHALELARRGFAVTGVDRTPASLDGARAAAAAERLEVEWVEADMRAFERPAAFDLAIVLFTSFGFFADPADDRAVLDRLARSLRPGGALVLDVAGEAPPARAFVPRHRQEQRDGALVLEERAIGPGWERIEMRWILARDGDRREARLDVRVYSAAELRALLAEAGFATVAVHGGLDGSPYDDRARRLVAVART